MNDSVSQQTIADQVGVSKNAVSIALSGKSGVSPATREKIVATAETLGYIPLRNRSRRRTSKRSVGIVIRQVYLDEPQFFGPLLALIQHSLAVMGRNTLVHAVSTVDEHSLKLPVWMEEQSLDAVIVISKLSTEYLLVVQSRAVLLLVDHYDPLVACDAILTNNIVGGYLATHRLVLLGHRRIGFMGFFPKDGAPSNAEREFGYAQALKTLGSEVAPPVICRLTDERDEVQMQDYILGLKDPPTAWCCANDLTAFHLVRCLTNNGTRVPENVSVIGFDDLSIGTLSSPPLDTVRVDKAQYAKCTAEHLAWRVANPDLPYEHVSLRPSLIKRESVAALSVDKVLR